MLLGNDKDPLPDPPLMVRLVTDCEPVEDVTPFRTWNEGHVMSC
jgi:hypothetical protein